ncbi:MAG: hypothetical protein CTY24_01650 [Methylobacter sp.]|nr:MAG: hypothetical protein CTY24_01650 [Methylobacter sp.]
MLPISQDSQNTPGLLKEDELVDELIFEGGAILLLLEKRNAIRKPITSETTTDNTGLFDTNAAIFSIISPHFFD